MASVKMFCVLLSVILFFGEIRANVVQESAAPTRHKLSSSSLPPSILYLLRRRPLVQRSHPVRIEEPTPPCAPLAPTPVSPNNPNLPSAPLRPSAPSSPSAPFPPSAPLPQRQPIPYHQQGIAAQNPYQKEYPDSSPGLLSYDNPANGNRKLLNVVHIPFRQTYPEPLGDTPLNENKQDNTSNGSQETLPSSPDIVPTDNIKTPPKSDSFNDKVTDANGDTANSKNYITFNPKDLPYEPVDNIEASPIPRPGNKVLSNSLGSGAPADTSTINSKDLTPIPTDTIGAPPISVKPTDQDTSKDVKQDNFEPTKSADDVESGSAPTLKNKDTSDQEKSNESSSVPDDTKGPQQEVSETPQDVLLDSETSNKPNKSDISDNGSNNSDNEHETTKAEEPENPLKDLVLNGSSSTKPKSSDNGCTESIPPTDGVVSNGNSSDDTENNKNIAQRSPQADDSKTLKDNVNDSSANENKENEDERVKSADETDAASSKNKSEVSPSVNNSQSESSEGSSTEEREGDEKQENSEAGNLSNIEQEQDEQAQSEENATENQ